MPYCQLLNAQSFFILGVGTMTSLQLFQEELEEVFGALSLRSWNWFASVFETDSQQLITYYRYLCHPYPLGVSRGETGGLACVLFLPLDGM